MWRSCVGGLFCLALFACETTPAAVDLTPAEFNQVVSDAKGKWHPWVTVETFTEVLETKTLSDSQRARMLIERGQARQAANIDLPGAVSDFQQALALTRAEETTVTDPAIARSARTGVTNAEAALEAARSRLAGMQTLSDWFDDMVATDQLERGVERYKASGLAPEPDDAALLEAAGYLCPGAKPAEQAWELGYELEYLRDLTWCESPATT